MQQPPYDQSGFYNQPTSQYWTGQQLPLQQPPMMPPPQPPKKRRRLWIVLAIVGGLLFSCIACSVFASTLPKPPPTVQVTPTTKPTQAGAILAVTVTPTAKPTATPKPTIKPTATSKPGGILVTHGQPHLGGPISDFYGKYGTQITGDVQSGSAPNNNPSESVGWVTDSDNAYFLSVHYYTNTHIVFYINYVGSSDWSKTQYRDYLLSFAPAGTAEDTQTNQYWVNQGGDPYNPIAYTSNIGRFFLHISDGSGYMNTV